MKHAREDYNRFQDPAVTDPSLLGEGSTPIGEDEPVMLFRAKDKYFCEVLTRYAYMLEVGGADMKMVKAVHAQVQEARVWQEKNGSALPDIP